MDYVDHSFESPTVLSFCPGILGLERGLERAIGPIRVAAYVEIEAFIIANLLTAMEAGVLDPVPIWTDAKTFDARPFRGKIHGIIGGYPCQPFSKIGKMLGDQDPRHLWPFLKNCIATIKPAWCFFENVSTHIKLGYRTVRQELESMGYTVKEGIFTAEEIGAPHERKRLFILAMDYSTCFGYQPKYSISTRRNSPQFTSKTMADSIGQRLEKRFEQSTRKECAPFKRSRFDKWPMGQGYEQHEWEEPRTIEPGMGCSVDGYNFREDLLRAYGNSVVEQTAELAFRTLLQKHFND